MSLVGLRSVVVVLVGLSVIGFLGTALATPDRTLITPTARTVLAAPAPQILPEQSAAAVEQTPLVDPAWVDRTAAATGIAARALTSYAAAQLSGVGGCQVGWTTLAGIGWVESQHGTIDGRTLLADGRSSAPILGPELNGAGPVAAIPATLESSGWHGNSRWDHAVGPMQFIPSTWRTWATDGDGDGVLDPNDLDDAAAAAARYLCADGHDLRTGSGWAAAVFSYNHSQSYVDAVHAAATAYAQPTTSASQP